MVRYSSCVTRSDAAACQLCSHCGDVSQSAASTPTCVIANAINDQADAQGLALHPISLFWYMLERKAEIVKTLDTVTSPESHPHLFFWISLNITMAGESLNRDSLKSSQLTFTINIKFFLYLGCA